MEAVDEQRNESFVEETNDGVEKDEDKAFQLENLLTSGAGSVVNMSSTPIMLASPFKKPLLINADRENEGGKFSSLMEVD
uniref:Uncharacterized protein n=1 Tax=Romanomermis culicivorax TaxID=13658 RepID=A0A915KVK0_ROMCU